MKSWRVVKFSIQNLTRCKIFNSKSVKFWNFFSEIWFISCLSSSDWRWYLLSTLIPTYFKEENWKTMRFLVSRHMDNWKLPHNNNSSLDVRGMPSWQHTILTEGTDRTLWSIKCSSSAVFLKTHICENKRKSSSVRILAIFSNVFVWATRRRAMEEAGFYTASIRYWLRNVICQNLETYQNGQCLIENWISRHVMLKT